MADMLNVAVSGLRAFQRALDTTSHNIANATTPGYSRQRVNLISQEPQSLGRLNLGRGVTVGSVDRYYDALLANQARTASSAFSRLDAYADKADALNRLFADSSTGLTASLQKFTNALQGVANTPNSSSARQVLLSEASGLTQRLQSYHTRLDQIDADISARLRDEASTISGIAANIARLNGQIISQQGTTGSPPNDLLDQRDAQLAELATHVNVTSVAQDDGAVNVFIGNGQSLVLGAQAGTISTRTDAFQPLRSTLVYEAGGVATDIGSQLSGGTVGGLMDFRREMLDPARNQLGQIAMGVAAAVNAQHHEGMDLNGALGGDFFAIGGVNVLPAQGNTGSGTVTVTRTDVGAVIPQDYRLERTGSGWQLRVADTGATVALSGTGTAADPFVADGLSIVVGGSAAAGDRFLIQPTATAVDGFKVLISDPARIAAAAPIRTSAAAANTGNGVISAGEVLDAANPALRSTVQIQFTSATTYTINGAGSYTYTPGADIDVNGWRMSISGTPQAGDSFTVADNVGGVGDNRNALELASALGKGLFSGGTESLNAASSRIVGRIGVQTNQAQVSRDAQQVIHDDTVAANDSVRGVNLDEEAANLMRYQQAYQAAAQVIRVTQQLFDVLMSAAGR